MKKYIIGDMVYDLGQIAAIKLPYGWDANKVCCEVWLIGESKTTCTIESVGNERNRDTTGAMNLDFRSRAYSQFESFRKSWIRHSSEIL
jgi:hypothetical protein